jgi:hypothetical protein
MLIVLMTGKQSRRKIDNERCRRRAGSVECVVDGRAELSEKNYLRGIRVRFSITERSAPDRKLITSKESELSRDVWEVSMWNVHITGVNKREYTAQ